MSFWFWKGASFSSALVDSALAGSQDDAWLSWTPVSLLATEPAAISMMIQKARTNHFVTRPVSFPAICLCMIQVKRMPPTTVIGVYPEFHWCCRIVIRSAQFGLAVGLGALERRHLDLSGSGTAGAGRAGRGDV